MVSAISQKRAICFEATDALNVSGQQKLTCSIGKSKSGRAYPDNGERQVPIPIKPSNRKHQESYKRWLDQQEYHRNLPSYFGIIIPLKLTKFISLTYVGHAEWGQTIHEGCLWEGEVKRLLLLRSTFRSWLCQGNSTCNYIDRCDLFWAITQSSFRSPRCSKFTSMKLAPQQKCSCMPTRHLCHSQMPGS